MSTLYQKNCNTGGHSKLYPVTTLEKVINESTGESLDQILQKYNHIWLPFKGNSKALTRQQVPANLRRRGLWITYISCAGKTVTEWYDANDYSDKAWGNNENWVQYTDKATIEKMVKESISWYKA